MPRLNVPLTRSTLLQTQRSVQFARQGYELLDRKRQVLLSELMATVQDAEDARQRLEEGFDAAYRDLADARMAMGAHGVRWASTSVATRREITVTERSVMGAIVPTVGCPSEPVSRPDYSLAGTAAALDRAAQSFNRLLNLVCRSAETETTVSRLGREIRKTQRRVKALENVVIPQQEAIIKAVQEELEEVDREAFLRAKAFKRLAERHRENV